MKKTIPTNPISMLRLMRRPKFKVPIIILLTTLIIVTPVSQKRATAVEPTTVLLVSLLAFAAAGGAIEGAAYSVDCWVFHGGNWNQYDFWGHVTAGGLKGMAMFLVWIFPASVIIDVLGCAATVPGVSGALGDIIGDFFEKCVSGIKSVSAATFGNIKDNITGNLNEFKNRFLPTLEALCNANGAVPSDSSFDPIWADFSNAAIEKSNITINTVGMEYNSYEGRSWRMLYPGTSNLQATFNLSQVPSGVILSLTHLSSADSGAPGGGYSPVDIYINGHLFLDNYDVAQHHCGSHGYETDQWQIEQYLVSGQNTITISFEDDPWVYTHYWIQSLAVTCGSLGADIPNYTVTASASAHGLIEPSGNICPAAGDSKTFYATPDSGYVVDKWYVNGELQPGSEGSLSFTLENVEQDASVLVTFKPEPQPANLNIITPTAGDYARGYRMYIGWQAKGLTGNVKIELLYNAALYYVIEDSVPATVGKYTWNMSSDIPVGDNYTIKISSLSSSVAGESEAFSIVDVSESASPIEIHNNISELQAVSSGQVFNSRIYSPTAHYILVDNIDASAVANFVPIGIDDIHYFRGVFDGQNHKIINLKIDRTDEVIGLFKVLMHDGTIKNLTLEGGTVRAKGTVGALIGESAGTVINCHSSARVRTITTDATNTSGGLIGCLGQGTLRNSSTYYLNDKSEVASYSDDVGGLVGENFYGSIKWCWSSFRRADAENMVKVGGIAGYNSGLIEECYTALTLETRGESHVGGVVGWNDGTVRNCYCGSQVRGETGYNTGGIVGKNDGIVEKCYNYGHVKYSGVGGLIGENYYGSVLNSFWDIATSGTSQPVGGGTGSLLKCYGLPTSDMKRQNTYTSADWDFDNIWTIDEGVDYPRLRGAKRCLMAPTGINASNGQAGKITITWNSVADAGAYRVYRSDSSDGVFNPITTWLADGLSYQDVTAIADVSFYYKVKAAYTIYGAGESEFSNSDEGMCTFQLPCPNNVTATTDLEDFVLLQWDSVSGAGYYRVYRCESELGTKTAVTSWTDSLSFVDSNVEWGVAYYYWGTAAADNNGTGESEFGGPAIGAIANPDITSDGKVDFRDFAKFSAFWFKSCSNPSWCGDADIDHSGEVGIFDLAILAEYWLGGTMP